MNSKYLRRLVISLLALFMVFSSFGQSAASATFRENELDQPFTLNGWTYVDQVGGGVSAVTLNGSTAYIGQGFGLSVIDVADPANPQKVSTLPLKWNVEEFSLSGHYAYIAAGSVEILDIQDPKRPVWRGRYETSQIAYGIQVTGSRAYVAASEVEILDLTNPVQPVQIGKYTPSSYAYDVFVVGNLGYVLHNSLDIVDFSDPAKPVKLGSVGSFFGPRTVWVEGSFAYVSATSGLYVIDVSQPIDPKQVWHLSALGEPPVDLFFSDFKGSGNRGYAAISGSQVPYSGLYVFDLSEPNSPQLLGRSEPTFLSSRKLDIGAGLVYLTGFEEGMQIFDMRNPAAPILTGRYATPFSSSNAATTAGQNFFVAEYDRLAILDISDPENPRLRARFPIENHSYWIQVTDNRAYLETASRLITIDVSDPDHPALLGNPELLPPPTRLYIHQNRAYSVYCTNRDGQPPAGELKIFDIMNPAQAVALGTYPAKGCPSDVQVVGDLAYLTSYDAQYFYLQILDIRNPGLIVPHGLYSGTNSTGQWIQSLAHWTTIADGRAYLTDWNGGLTVVDVRAPDALSRLSSVAGLPNQTRFNPSSPLVKGSLVYLSSFSLSEGTSTLRIFDISNPAWPRLDSSVELRYFLDGIERAGNCLYLLRGGLAGEMVIFRESPVLYFPILSR